MKYRNDLIGKKILIICNSIGSSYKRLYCSYILGKIIEYNPIHEIGGKKIKNIFTEYTNVDSIVFGRDIFKCLAYIEKYSDFNLTPIREEFIKQCNWLKKNEPEFAPEADDFGKWFDDKIKSEIN